MQASTKIRVLCVDDSRDIADLMGQCIGAEPDMESAGCLYCADDLLGEVGRTRADIVLLDMKMPGKDPIAALSEVAESTRAGAVGTGARVIVYSGNDDHAAVNRAMDAGAWAYVSKDAEIASVFEAIREVARGKVTCGVWN